MKLWTPKALAALLLVVTLCFMLVALVVNAMLHPDNVSDKGKEFIFQIIMLLIGVVSGWVFGKADDKPIDKEPK